METRPETVPPSISLCGVSELQQGDETISLSIAKGILLGGAYPMELKVNNQASQVVIITQLVHINLGGRNGNHIFVK